MFVQRRPVPANRTAGPFALIAFLSFGASWPAIVGAGHSQSESAPATEGRPNILMIVADDLGWRDVGYHGSDIKTPVLDQLAREGIRLERHYVYPTCSPTRAGLLTGRNPSRYKIHSPIAGRSSAALPPQTMTLSKALRKAGYRTSLCGKWHLGLRPEVGPKQYGFDQTYGYFHGQIDPLTHRYKNGDRTWHRNDEFVDEEGHATDLIASEAEKFLRSGNESPFFLWVAFSVPHHPLQEEARWQEVNSKIDDPSRRMFAASVSHMDAAIGRLLAALDETRQRSNTIVLFVSDNGGQKNYQSRTEYEGRYGPNPVLGDNRPWRGWKGDLYEGGIRVPAVVSWKGRLTPRSEPGAVSLLDWFPTFCRSAGIDPDPSWKLEGRDLWPLLEKGANLPDSHSLFWNIGRRKSIIVGDWKLIRGEKASEGDELYDLSTDPKETANLSAEKPETVKRLGELLIRQASLDP